MGSEPGRRPGRHHHLIRRTASLVAAAAAACGAVAAVPAMAAQAAGTQGVPVGAAPAVPHGAIALGRTAGSQALSFDVVLRPRDQAGLSALALSVSSPGSPDYGRYLTVRQFAAAFGQPPAAISAADAALRGAGLTPGRVTANHLIIPVTTTIAGAEAALRTGFVSYRLASGRVAFANTAAPRLPRALAGMTLAVVGLNDLLTPAVTPPAPRAAARQAARPAQAAGPRACLAARAAAAKYRGWTYPQLASAYDLTALYRHRHLGAGTRIALFELDQWSASDIAAFQSCSHTKVRVRTVKVDGGDRGGANNGEATLDIETEIALAPKAALTVYDAPITNYARSVVDEFASIFDHDNAQVVSVSYGLCEQVVRSISSGLLGAENVLFEQAATEGISVFVASGDSGSEGCYRADHSTGLATLDLGSQPFVTSVGGTDLTSVSRPPHEKVWNEGVSSGEGAGGGGISSAWPMPRWQSGPGVISSRSSGAPCGASSGYCREVPDVTASADPVHGYIIRWRGQWLPIGGTSAATPLWAAILADIESAHHPAYRAGFLNPLLYAAAATGKGGFNDIRVGNNDYTGTNGGLYPATPRYDMASGLGSPVAGALARIISSHDARIAFTGAPGTGSPPRRLGQYKVQRFRHFTCRAASLYRSVSGPTGRVGFFPRLKCEPVGRGWATWSNGYKGDVYWAYQHFGKATTVTLTLPRGTRAFYFYAEPDKYAVFDLKATAQNGLITVGPSNRE